MSADTFIDGGDRVAAALEAHGVSHVFTLCGGHVSPILRSSGQRVSRWIYRYFLRSLDGDEFDFVRSLDAYEEVDRGEEDDEGQDDDDAERPGAR
jgi:hypothetical protein